MELLLAFIIKFFSLIYGAIYGILVSVPLIKDWIARGKVGITIDASGIVITNTGHKPFVIVDGHVLMPGVDETIGRQVLQPKQSRYIPLATAGTVYVWLKLVDVVTGKELVITESKMFVTPAT